jgi:hypothetical protein
MKNKVSDILFTIWCLSIPIWKAYSNRLCSLYAVIRNDVTKNTTSIGIKPIEDVKLVNIKLQGFWEPLLYNNYWSTHFYTLDAVISLLFVALFMILRTEFASFDGSKFNNKSNVLAKSLIFISAGYGLSKIFFLDDVYNTFINGHLPKGLVQINEGNSGIFWAFIPVTIAIATYKMFKQGKELQNQLNELKENKTT